MSLMPMHGPDIEFLVYDGEMHNRTRTRRVSRPMLVGGTLVVLMACALVVDAAVRSGGFKSLLVVTSAKVPIITPTFVDWKKEDAGSSHTNLHLKVHTMSSTLSLQPNHTQR